MSRWNIPDIVSVGGADYTVEVTEAPLILNSQVCAGTHNANSTEILLSATIGLERQIEVFLHEVLHAIVYDRQINIEEWDEEQIVDALGHGLAAFCKANNMWFRD